MFLSFSHSPIALNGMYTCNYGKYILNICIAASDHLYSRIYLTALSYININHKPTDRGMVTHTYIPHSQNGFMTLVIVSSTQSRCLTQRWRIVTSTDRYTIYAKGVNNFRSTTHNGNYTSRIAVVCSESYHLTDY